MIFKNNEIKKENVFDGLERKILSHGGKLMTVECYMEKDTVIPAHSHEHEQCAYILSGKYKATIDGDESILSAGDSYYVDSYKEHGLVCIESGMFLDIFTPQREDFKK